jgi:hypothetical protein
VKEENIIDIEEELEFVYSSVSCENEDFGEHVSEREEKVLIIYNEHNFE